MKERRTVIFVGFLCIMLGLVVGQCDAHATTIFPTHVAKKTDWAWDPASGPIHDYGVILFRPYGADAFWGWVSEPAVTIVAAPGDIFGLMVWGRDGAGSAGPMSNRSITVRVIPEPRRLCMLVAGLFLLAFLHGYRTGKRIRRNR